MPKFDIYLIWGKDCEGNILRYYGSTTNFIKRKYNHKVDYNRWVKNGRPINNCKKCSSVLILDNGDWKMEKIDEIIGEKWEARKLESEYQKNNKCVNVNIASRNAKEYRTDKKARILEKMKEYYNLNNERIKEKTKEYNILNKQKISEKRKQKIICECGAEVTKTHIVRHRKSKKHINFINSANND